VGHVPRRQRWKGHAFEQLQRQLVFNTFSQTDETWGRVHEGILSFRPTLVVGYVSSLEQFAEYVTRTGKPVPRIKAVIAAAEPLFADARTKLESAFGAPVFNTYGSREFMSIAGECENHEGLHINAENLLVETRESSTTEPSELLVTDLHNY